MLAVPFPSSKLKSAAVLFNCNWNESPVAVKAAKLAFTLNVRVVPAGITKPPVSENNSKLSSVPAIRVAAEMAVATAWSVEASNKLTVDAPALPARTVN